MPIGPEARPAMVGPLVVLAHQAAQEWPAGLLPPDADVRPHPHIGLVAMTYMLRGHITHRDSLGVRSEIGAGGINCLIAGRGAVHSERFERARILGGTIELLQFLIALPDHAEEVEPSFMSVDPERVPVVTHEGATARCIVDASPGAPSAVALPAAMFAHDVQLAPGARYAPPVGFTERVLYVLTGALHVEGSSVGPLQTVVLGAGAVSVEAVEASRVIAVGGEPVGPRYLWWNFIHSSLERIEQAKAEWRAGRMTLPPGDTESFTPAPPDDGRPLRRFDARV